MHTSTQASDRSGKRSPLKYYHVFYSVGYSSEAVLQDMQIYQCKHALLTSCKCKSLTLLIDLCKASPRQCRYEEKMTGIRGTFRNQLSKRKRDEEGRVKHKTLIIIWSGKNKLKSIWKKTRICCFGFVYKRLNDAFSFVLSVQDSTTSSTSCCYI